MKLGRSFQKLKPALRQNDKIRQVTMRPGCRCPDEAAMSCRNLPSERALGRGGFCPSPLHGFDLNWSCVLVVRQYILSSHDHHAMRGQCPGLTIFIFSLFFTCHFDVPLGSKASNSFPADTMFSRKHPAHYRTRRRPLGPCDG